MEQEVEMEVGSGSGLGVVAASVGMCWEGAAPAEVGGGAVGGMLEASWSMLMQDF